MQEYRIIDQNEDFRKFDFSSLITESDVKEAKTIIEKIIADGNFWENSPKYQTKENIFARPEYVWLKFRMSFLFSVFMYLGREVKVGNMQAWSFMTSLKTQEDREKLWHHHQHKPSPQSMSGIWYLDIPEDVENRDLCGTEIAPNGPENGGKFFVKPSEFNWLIYPSKYWHRPGIPQSDKYRFIIAADVEIL
jgi:hypothetical protein